MSTRKFRSFGLVIAGAVAGVLLSVGVSAVAQRGNPLPLEELRQFSNVFGAIKANYVEEVDDKTLVTHAISGMISNLDPHSAFLNKDAFADMQMSTLGEFGGLGIEVGAEDGFVKIISPIEGTPAARAGVMAGDLIVKIDNTPTKGLALNESVKLMRGKPGTPIKLTIMRGAEALPRVIDIMRETIKVRSVRSKMLDNNIGYVRVAQFQEKTGADLARHLIELGAKGAPRGLVLDLRNDPGGLLTGAIGVAGAFLPPETLIVSTDGRTAGSRHKYLATPSEYARGEADYLKDLPDWVKKVPMVVLINVGSASASEIVAGALQDYDRATVMGNRSFGKGSVQVILPLSEETAIKLTTSRYFTPKNRSIQATGIMPDMVVPDTAQGDLFRLPREADLQRHLANQQTIDEIKSLADAAVPNNMKMFEFGGAADFQLKQAINQLEGKPVQKGELRPATPEDQKGSVKPSPPELPPRANK
jgi:carboxyl-terminal processing protease